MNSSSNSSSDENQSKNLACLLSSPQNGTNNTTNDSNLNCHSTSSNSHSPTISSRYFIPSKDTVMERNKQDASLMLNSPNAISEAALAEAMKDCKRSRLSSASSWDENSNHHVDSSIPTNIPQSEVDIDNINNNANSNNIDSPNSFTIHSNIHTNTEEQDDRNKRQKTIRRRKNSYGKATKISSIEKAIKQINEIQWKSKKKSNNKDDDGDNTTVTGYENIQNTSIILDNSSEIENALEKMKKIVYTELEHIIRAGLEIFHKNDSLKRELTQSKEMSESRKREIQRLKASEVDTRTSMSNLLQAIEASKSNARDSSRAAQTEARLRGEISSIRSERDVAIGTNRELKRKTNLLEEEVRMLKSRVARLTQDKIKIERESRAALGLARSMDTHVASDVEFYRRKVSDLNDHLHSKNTIISELKHQVNSYKREMERSLSQNRLSQIRQSEKRKR